MYKMKQYIHSIGSIDTQYLEELKGTIEYPTRFTGYGIMTTVRL